MYQSFKVFNGSNVPFFPGYHIKHKDTVVESPKFICSFYNHIPKPYATQQGYSKVIFDR